MLTEERSAGRLPRAAALGTPTLAALVATMLMWRHYSQWNFTLLQPAADALLHGDLRVFAEYPKAQEGPLALALLDVVPLPFYPLLVLALMPVALHLTQLGIPMNHRRWACLLAGGVLMAWPWAGMPCTAHLDDALVIVGTLAMIGGLRTRRDWLACAAFLLAIAAKPTAILLLPLLLLTRRRTMLIALVGMAAIWTPFALADPHGFVIAGRGVMIVRPGSFSALLGTPVGDPYPAWVRPMELLGGMALCWAVARRASSAAGIAVAFAFRAALEPGAFGMYSVPVIAAALAVDLAWRRWPAAAAAGLLSCVVAWGNMSDAAAVARIVALAAAGLLAMKAASLSSSRSVGSHLVESREIEPVASLSR